MTGEGAGKTGVKTTSEGRGSGLERNLRKSWVLEQGSPRCTALFGGRTTKKIDGVGERRTKKGRTIGWRKRGENEGGSHFLVLKRGTENLWENNAELKYKK